MYEIPYIDFTKAVLVFARMSAIIAIMPIFGFKAVPLQLKAALSVIMTFIVFPLVRLQAAPISAEPVELFLLLMSEVTVGLIIGFATNLLFYGVQMAGHLVGIQMGFGIINVVDPMSDLQVSLIGQLNYMVALLIFLAIDGHHFLVKALVLSYEYIGLGGGVFHAGILSKMSFLTGAIFDTALRLAAPMFVTLFITDVALGITARVAPQMNVFIVGFPLKIGVGLLIITLVIAYFPYIFGKFVQQFKIDMIEVLKLLGA